MNASTRSDQASRGSLGNGRNSTSPKRGYEHTPFAVHHQLHGTKTKLQMMSPPPHRRVSSISSKKQCCTSLKDSLPKGDRSWNAMSSEADSSARDSRVVTVQKRFRSCSDEKPRQSPEQLRRLRSQSMGSPPPQHRSRTNKIDFGPWSPPRSTPLPVAPRDSGRPPLWSPPRDDSHRLPLFRSKFNKIVATATVDHEPLAWLGVPTTGTASRSNQEHGGADRGACKDYGRPTRLFPTFDGSLDAWK